MVWKDFSLTHVTYPTSDGLLGPILALLSLLPPFGVCALVTGSIIYKDVVAAYFLVGLLCAAGTCSVLKVVLKQPRPPRYDDLEGEVEYGMPSNHACNAFFGAAFVVLYALRRGVGTGRESGRADGVDRGVTSGTKYDSTTQIKIGPFGLRLWEGLHTHVFPVIVILIAMGCAYSRIRYGYHTWNQVVVGSILGVTLGTLWYQNFGKFQQRLVNIEEWIHALEVARGASASIMCPSSKSD